MNRLGFTAGQHVMELNWTNTAKVKTSTEMGLSSCSKRAVEVRVWKPRHLDWQWSSPQLKHFLRFIILSPVLHLLIYLQTFFKKKTICSKGSILSFLERKYFRTHCKVHQFLICCRCCPRSQELKHIQPRKAKVFCSCPKIFCFLDLSEFCEMNSSVAFM